MGCVVGCPLGSWVDLVVIAANTLLPKGCWPVIRNQKTRSFLRALDFTAVVVCPKSKQARISIGDEKNVLIVIYNNPSLFFQSNVPSLVFYLSGLLALSLPLPLALSSAEVLCPGNRTGNDT